MNVYQIKKYLKNKIGAKAKIKCNLGRNKYETYIVTLDKLYDNVFTVIEEKEYGPIVKCFSYNDIMMHLIRIDFHI